MNRTYSDSTSDSVSFFIGTEIEQTPAYGQKTLFVVGLHPAKEIMGLAISNNCKHIYFGANQSFKSKGANDAGTWLPWEDMIKMCLHANFWCTFDVDVSDVEGLVESGLSEYRRFIPHISVKIPYLQLLNYNTTIKIDDKDFEASNPGVWSIPLTDLTQRKYFTDWDEYTKDEIIL